MRNVVFLNRWGHVYHLMLVAADGDNEHLLRSRICLSLGEARALIEHWRRHYYIGPDDVQDNSRLDMNELLNGMDPDSAPTRN
jgi:hypothetical protein